MPLPPLFLILPGATADRERIAALQQNAAAAWSEALRVRHVGRAALRRQVPLVSVAAC
jgi:hypothetical protein